MIAKNMNRRGEMATGTMMIMIVSLASTGVVGSVVVNTMSNEASVASDLTNDTLANMVNGFTVIDATGYYENDTLTSISYIVRNGPGSAPNDLDNVTVIVNNENGQTTFVLDAAQVRILNGDDDTYLERGEMAKLTVPMDGLAVGEDVDMKMVVGNGQIMVMSFVVPDSMGHNFVVFR